ncbi:unnamed protein product [Paramecium sonneborni]|uniref:Uncharacterized protein n=1 Tax=Paramecium sonneborni TaxID=65129 RepID=A0A8S1LM35_9CILI|nr:unnamed protein product [Paramecium sonneborni]
MNIKNDIPIIYLIYLETNKKDKKVQNENDNQLNDKDAQFEDCLWDLDKVELLKNSEQSQTNLDQKSFRFGYPDYKKALQRVEYLVTEQQQCLQILQQNYNYVGFTT